MLGLFTALAFQTATLPAPTFDAAKLCARASAVADAATISAMRRTARYTYFAMHATLASPAGKSYLDRLNEVASQIPSDGTLSEADAKLLTGQCNARFAPPSPPAKLPGGFDGDLICFLTLSVLQGAAEEIEKSEGDATNLNRIDAALKPLLAKLTDEALAAKGLGDDAKFTSYLGEQAAASLKIGDPIVVAQACGVSLS